MVAGNRLRELREARGLSLVSLGKLAGTTGQQISHLELGRRHLTVEWLEKLAAVLECHPWDIVSDGGPADLREQRLVAMFRLMTPEDQSRLLADASIRLNRKARA